MARRVATSVESLGTIVVVDSDMIRARAAAFRRIYAVQLLRALADSIEDGYISSIQNVQWNGSTNLSGTATFTETGEETFTFDLS